jgi:flagellar motor switch protein FliG
MTDKTIVLTMFGKNDSVENISISLFDTIGSYYKDNNAENFCENINNLELKDNKWVYASVIEENEKIMMKKPFEINVANFERINALDDRALQKIFREASPTNIAIALKDVNEETKEKIFRNVSKRIAAIIKEDMELNNTGNENVIIARKKIIEIITQLNRTGEIVIAGDINI